MNSIKQWKLFHRNHLWRTIIRNYQRFPKGKRTLIRQYFQINNLWLQTRSNLKEKIGNEHIPWTPVVLHFKNIINSLKINNNNNYYFISSHTNTHTYTHILTLADLQQNCLQSSMYWWQFYINLHFPILKLFHE